MKCPVCECLNSTVIDSRPVESHLEIRRRRACESCGKRFTTYEKIEAVPIIVIKKNKNKENFDRNKMKKGIMTACRKRPVSLEIIDEIVNAVESDLQGNFEGVTSHIIGNKIMEQLKQIDEVAYIRFASVYKDFENLDSFINEITKLKS